MIQETSLLAYDSIQNLIGERQKEVYLMLKSLGSANNSILAKKLNLPINRITPRILELRQMGLVEKDSMRVCPITKRLTWFWRCSLTERRTLE